MNEQMLKLNFLKLKIQLQIFLLPTLSNYYL